MANAADRPCPFTQGTRAVQQGPAALKSALVVPQGAIFVHIVAQASNHRPQLDAPLGQDKVQTQHQPQGNASAFLCLVFFPENDLVKIFSRSGLGILIRIA
jgi:hypothetical protein